jgi:pimeloyl-ACP methyl ester carboxylesterase
MQPLYDRMEEIYPGLVRKVLLPGVGHGAPEESPDLVAVELAEFLDRFA